MLKKKRPVVLIPESLWDSGYCGNIYGNHFEESGRFNIVDENVRKNGAYSLVGLIQPSDDALDPQNDGLLHGTRTDDGIEFRFGGAQCEVERYDLVQNLFSRNTGILESGIMSSKCAIILGCGSVGSLVALELARAGVGNFVLVDNDIVEYHNLCRHQCGVSDVGDYKVRAVAKRIRDINPTANVEEHISIVEGLEKKAFDDHCQSENVILVGCADNRPADVYANSLAVMYRVPFISIGFWERAFAGELFYYLPDAGMPCYRCALGDGGAFSQRTSANHRVYTNEEDLSRVNFEPGISVDINFVTTVGVKLILDILNRNSANYTPRLLAHLKQYTLICNTNETAVGGEMAEIFSYPLQVTTSLTVDFCEGCPPCKYEN